MGKLIKGSAGSGSDSAKGKIDWSKLKADIISHLDIKKEYTELGVKFGSGTPSPKGFLECHAMGRPDHNPSAAINLKTGVYVDAGGDHSTLGFLEFALRNGNRGSWLETAKYYADKAGVPFGRPEFSSKGKILEEILKYVDDNGDLQYGVFRYRMPNGVKDFRQCRWDGKEWHKEKGNMDGVRPLPYQLPELISASKDETIFIAEGEKDVDRLRSEGLTATTNHQGSNSTDVTWPQPSFLPWFKGRDCVVIADNDEAGHKHAHKVCGHLFNTAGRIRYLELPNLPQKGDVSDWLDAGNSIEDLGRLAFRAIDWTPSLAEDAKGKPLKGTILYDLRHIEPDDIQLTCFEDIEAKEVQWLIPNKVAIGKMTLFVGIPDVGKSYITTDLVARVTRGAEIPGAGGQCFEPGSALIFSAEDDPNDTIKPRLVKCGADCSKVHVLSSVKDSTGSYTPFNLSYIDHLEHAVMRLKDCKLIIIDPVSSYIGSGTDEHRNAEIRSILKPLSDMAARQGVAVIIVVHLNRSSGTSVMARIGGSYAYVQMCRSSWFINKDKEDPEKCLITKVKNNTAPRNQGGLAYRIGDDGLVNWLDEAVTMTADESLTPDSKPTFAKSTKAGSLDLAVAWLREHAAGKGMMDSVALIAEARKAGIARDPMYKAKEALGGKARKGMGDGAPWFWEIPADAPEGPEVTSGDENVPF
jgi:putative DNA primase/helicase